MRSALRSTAPSTPSPFTPRRIIPGARVVQRPISSTAMRMHGSSHDQDHEGQDHSEDFVPIGKAGGSPIVHTSVASHGHGHDHDHDHDHEHDHAHDSDDDSDDDQDMVDTVALGPSGLEYGGPQRGGAFKEPTRFGDWERKGRCTDF
jgi:hypothetical protein